MHWVASHNQIGQSLSIQIASALSLLPDGGENIEHMAILNTLCFQQQSII